MLNLRAYTGKVILASRSPWRKRLLEKHGIACRIHVSGFKEITWHATPRRLVLLNARGKAMDTAQFYQKSDRPHIIIGVDTVGVLGKKILGKPRDRKDAAAMLRSLRGKRHQVITGLCVIDTRSGKKYERVVATKIWFRKFTEAELERYLKSGQWKGKAGSYAIQGRAKGFVEKIKGDVTNVVGLPMPVFCKILEKIV